MKRMMAIVEREMRKFVRSPALMLVAMIFPLVQLIVLGNAFGGKIHDARLGIVDHDRTLIQGVETDHPQALRIREALNAIHANARTLDAVDYSDEKIAIGDVHNGKIDGVVVIPENYSRDVYMGRQPRHRSCRCAHLRWLFSRRCRKLRPACGHWHESHSAPRGYAAPGGGRSRLPGLECDRDPRCPGARHGSCRRKRCPKR